MKAYALDFDKKPEDIEKNVWVRRNDPSLWRRAERIFRIKIYFLLHERDGYRSRNDPVGRASPFLIEGKIIVSFIFSLFVLSMLVTSRSPQGIAAFMAAMIPVIFFVTIVGVMFSVLNRLADRYNG